MKRRALLAVALAPAGCAHFHRKSAPAAIAATRAVLGPPYQAGGIWRYPSASYDLVETGLAIVARTHRPLCTDGAAWDRAALMGDHPTLQLPCVVRLTNLETGRRIWLRLDDRGPAAPGRMLAITPRAATLLGARSDAEALRVRLQVDEGASRRLIADLGDPDAPPLIVTAAPVGAVRTEPLAPPVGAVGRANSAEPARPLLRADRPPMPGVLPDTVEQGPIYATQLFIDAGGVGAPYYAEVLRDRLGGLGAFVVRNDAARPETAYRVRIGPLATVGIADSSLNRVLNAGVVDARIIVE